MDSSETLPIMFWAFLFHFDIVKTWYFRGTHEKFLEDDCTIRWHIDCVMSRPEAIRQYPVRGQL